MALWGWLLAEREALADRRESAPLMLLDDVMSELDAGRREALVELLRSGDGQSVITATDAEQVPGAEQSDVHRLEVRDGNVAAVAAAERRMPSYRRSPRSLAVSLEPSPTSWRRRRCSPMCSGLARRGRRGLARQSTATAERGGVLTVSCADAMWAQELDLMSVQILAELNARLPSGSVRRLRCVAVGHGR